MDATLKEYYKASSDTSKLNYLSQIVEGLQNEKIWLRYNRLMYLSALQKLQNLSGRKYYLIKSFEALALNNIGYYYFNYSDKIDLSLIYYKKGMQKMKI